MEHFKFPGGETHVRVEPQVRSRNKEFIYTAILRDGDDIMKMLLACDAAKRAGYGSIRLIIPYVPYARQDRVCNDGEPLSIKVMADLINSTGADVVEIYDPHSDVTPALINNVDIWHAYQLVPNRILAGKTLICPDAGAEKKILKFEQPYLMATKIRNVETGEIVETQVEPPFLDSDEDTEYLIIDDICDGGRTFIEISKTMEENYAIKPSQMSLFVTHGIFSKGIGVLQPHFKNIYSINPEDRKVICW